MDSKEAIRTIETALNHLEQANMALIDAEVYDDEELFEEEACVLSNARECLALLAQSYPSHPAIPDEVRKVLTDAIAVLERVDMEDGDYEEYRGENGYKAARDWLAKCPTASGRIEGANSYCPRCGAEHDVSFDGAPGKYTASCLCGHLYEFEVRLVVISPPREPKGGSENVQRRR